MGTYQIPVSPRYVVVVGLPSTAIPNTVGDCVLLGAVDGLYVRTGGNQTSMASAATHERADKSRCHQLVIVCEALRGAFFSRASTNRRPAGGTERSVPVTIVWAVMRRP